MKILHDQGTSWTSPLPRSSQQLHRLLQKHPNIFGQTGKVPNRQEESSWRFVVFSSGKERVAWRLCSPPTTTPACMSVTAGEDLISFQHLLRRNTTPQTLLASSLPGRSPHSHLLPPQQDIRLITKHFFGKLSKLKQKMIKFIHFQSHTLIHSHIFWNVL